MKKVSPGLSREPFHCGNSGFSAHLDNGSTQRHGFCPSLSAATKASKAPKQDNLNEPSPSSVAKYHGLAGAKLRKSRDDFFARFSLKSIWRRGGSPWPQRLKSAASKEQASQSHAQAARLPPGKGRGAGGHRPPLWIFGARRKPDFNRLRQRLATSRISMDSRRAPRPRRQPARARSTGPTLWTFLPPSLVSRPYVDAIPVEARHAGHFLIACWHG